MDEGVLRLEGLRFRYPGSAHDAVAIDELRIDRGERVMLRGESGSGKSTLLSLASGVLVARHGSARLLGVDWAALSAGLRDRRRADHIGIVFQQLNLLPYLSVIDNVLLPCRFSALRRQRAVADADAPPACGMAAPTISARGAERRRAEALLDALQLEPSLWPRMAAALSVGQQQRVACARALIGSPALVIADEPTSALDEARRDAFMALLGRCCAAAGSALLFVSHDVRLGTYFERVVELPSREAVR